MPKCSFLHTLPTPLFLDLWWNRLSFTTFISPFYFLYPGSFVCVLRYQYALTLNSEFGVGNIFCVSLTNTEDFTIVQKSNAEFCLVSLYISYVLFSLVFKGKQEADRFIFIFFFYVEKRAEIVKGNGSARERKTRRGTEKRMKKMHMNEGNLRENSERKKLLIKR